MPRTKVSAAAAAADPKPNTRSRSRRRHESGEPSSASTVPQPPPAPVSPGGKLGVLVGLLRRAQGAEIAEMMQVTGWQAHSVRGALSGALKKKLGLIITSAKTDAGRVYRIADEANR